MRAVDEGEDVYLELPTIGSKEQWRSYVEAFGRDRRTPDRLTRRQHAALAPLERRRYDERRLAYHGRFGPLRHPDLEYLVEEIDELIDDNRLGGAPSASPGALVDAEGTLGKTTALMEIGRLYELRMRELAGGRRRPAGMDDFVPVVCIGIDGAETIKSFDKAIASYYGLPIRNGDLSTYREAVKRAAIRCRTTLFLIDDFHNLSARRQDHREVNGHIKYLANELPATFVFAGIECRHLLDEGRRVGEEFLSQTRGRIAVYGLSRHRVDDSESQREWATLVATFASHLVLLGGTDELWKRHAAYLHLRTGGSIGALSHLLRRAANRAIRSGKERITRDVLDSIVMAEAFEQHARSRGWKPRAGARPREAARRSAA